MSLPGDLVLAFAFFVTELLFINFPHALSKLATKPLSLAKAVNTNVLYFLPVFVFSVIIFMYLVLKYYFTENFSLDEFSFLFVYLF